ncbi:cupin domain-containing protein [Neoroseomonas soli]|uniref:Cupin domain-containing protein n=1 Tax=Neoroseomonas soli TaxID=1081025 RepID=A0A9X9WX90_9PROT|nr:cupin domain-containing protein [Neoroseomonas soli]MBR0671769.1 hypothetical protein [Neoroseomonas soli]
MRIRGLVPAVLLAVPLAAGPATPQSPEGFVLRRPGDIRFSGPPTDPARGAVYAAGIPQVAVLYGNPREAGLYVVQVRLPRNYRSEAHTHPEEVRTVIVLSGTLYFGFGDAWDEARLQAFPPGTFFNEPRTAPHFAGTRDEEVLMMVTGIGPTGVIPAGSSR